MRDLAPERLTRLLAMITYFSDGRRVPFAEAAEHFGISETQLLEDVSTLWVAGAPGYGHAELIDFEAFAFEEGYISLRESQQMDRPLRLSPAEAVTLLVAVDSLIARLGENQTLVSTRAKLQAAAGDAAAAAEAVHIERTPSGTLELREQIDAAIESQHRLQIRYVSGSDEVTTRKIDPGAMHASAEHWILVAWCHKAQARRQFRLDRILHLRVLEETFTTARDLPGWEPIETSTFAHQLTLTLRPAARWVLEQIPYESLTEGEGEFTVQIAGSNQRWLEQLCLRLGDSLISIDPPRVAQAVAGQARDALALYEQ